MISLVLLLTGCTPYKELKELSIVEGVGVDKNSDGSYLITFQVYKPSSSGGNGQGKQSSDSQTKNIQSSGVTLFDASRNATKQMGKKLYYSNMRAVLIGNEVCKSGMEPIMDFMERNHEISPLQKAFMTEGRAEDVFTAKSSDGSISAQKMSMLLQNNYNTSMVVDQTLGELEKIFTEKDNAFVLPILSLANIKSSGGSSGSSGSSGSGSSSGESESEKSIAVNSTAVMSNGKLAGTLNSEATRGLLWVEGKVKSGVINVTPQQGQKVSLEITKGSSKVSVKDENGKPKIIIDINVSSRMTENENSATKGTNISNLIDLQNKTVLGEVQAAVNLALKQYDADVFGFGQKVYENEPSLWRKVSNNWKENLKNLSLKVNVKSTINDIGLIEE